MPDMPTNARGWSTTARRWLPLLIATAVVMAAFHGTLNLFFSQDDFWFLEAAQDPSAEEVLLGVTRPKYFRPLACYWWLAGNYACFGLSPFGHHLTQLLLVALTATALFHTVNRWSNSTIGATVAATIYACSSVHLYTLGWIAGANDSLAALFVVMSLRALATSSTTGVPRTRAATCWLTAALLSKEYAVALPAAWTAALLFEWLWLRMRNQSRATLPVRSAISLCAASLAYVVIWIATTGDSEVTGHSLGFSIDRALTLLSHSFAMVQPAPGLGQTASRLWLLAPPLLAALTLRNTNTNTNTNRTTLIGLTLWFTPSLIFAIAQTPPAIQPYYANISVIGLAFLTGNAINHLLPTAPRSRTAATTILAIATTTYAALCIPQRIDRITKHQSPSMHQGRAAATIHSQLTTLLAAPNIRHLVFTNISPRCYAVMGNGSHPRVFFPTIQVHFPDFEDTPQHPTSKTTPTTLVLQETTPLTLQPVH